MGNEIGIKLADGSFYSILEEDFTGRKKLVVTTARDNQESVQIDLFRGSGEKADAFIGTLMLENIQPAPKREPEIELQVGLDPEGNLEAAASDPLSGERQSLSVSLSSLEGAETLEALDLEGETQARPSVQPQSFQPLAGESYPVGEADRRKERLERRKPRVLAVIGFVLLGLVVLAGAAYLAYRLLDGERIPKLFGGSRSAVAEQPAAEEPAEKPAPEPPAQKAAAAQPAVEAAEPAPKAPVEAAAGAAEGIWYRIVWGDTLWDLAGTYYRNPWLYPRLAKANNIANPDLIIAGHRLFIPKK